MSTDTSTMTTAQRDQAQARDIYRASLLAGDPITGTALAVKFGRKERWGQERIAEAKAAARTFSDQPLPGLGSLSLPPVMTPPAETAEVFSAPQPRAESTQDTDDSPEKNRAPFSDAPVVEPEAPQENPFAGGADAETAEAASAPRKPRKAVMVWPVWLLMLPASVAIWGGWVGLGEMAGFGVVNLLPGIANFEVNTAITLPVGMEVYAAYALYVWLSGRAVGKALRFAKRSACAALVIGAGGQVAYHVMEAAGVGTAPWYITAAVSCLPVAVLGMGAALAHLVKAETE
jgi:hypothetical protein